MSGAEQHRALLRLLFDARLRRTFEAQGAAALVAAGFSAEDAAVFAGVDPRGLAIDAAGRQRYLMSALCRAYPLSAAAIGAEPGGAEHLADFLASDALFLPPGPRSAAFGDHLAALLLALENREPEAAALLRAVLGVERARVDQASALRAAVGAGRAPPPPTRPSSADKKRAPLCLPPFTGLAVLPQPSGVLRAALDGVGPEDAWHRITSGALSFSRVRSVARAEPEPVTLLFRGVVGAVSVERGGAGGVAPLIEIRHLSVELRGRRDAWLAGLDGALRLGDLPPAQRRLAGQLLDAGLLALA